MIIYKNRYITIYLNNNSLNIYKSYLYWECGKTVEHYECVFENIVVEKTHSLLDLASHNQIYKLIFFNCVISDTVKHLLDTRSLTIPYEIIRERK